MMLFERKDWALDASPPTSRRGLWRLLAAAPLPLLVFLWALWRDVYMLDADGLVRVGGGRAISEWALLSVASAALVAAEALRGLYSLRSIARPRIDVMIVMTLIAVFVVSCNLPLYNTPEEPDDTTPNLTLTALFDTSGNIPATVTPTSIEIAEVGPMAS